MMNVQKTIHDGIILPSWTPPDAHISARKIVKRNGDICVGWSAQDRLAGVLKSVAIAADNLRRAVCGVGDTESLKINDGLTLHAHQAKGVAISRLLNRFCFFYDTRTGKTPMALTIAYEHIQSYDSKVLIVCPLTLVRLAWLVDAAKFFPDLNIKSLWGKTPAKRLKAIEKGADVMIINTEAFAANYDIINERHNIGMLIIDESSKMKDPSAKVTKALLRAAYETKRVYLLSGTPAPNSPTEYFSQLKAVDPFMFSSYSAFCSEFFINVSHSAMFRKYELRKDKEHDLCELIRRVSIYVDKHDVFDCPNMQIVKIKYELPADLKVAIKQMRKDHALTLEEQELTAVSAGVAFGKLMQLSVGFVNHNYTDENISALLTVLSEKHYEVITKLIKPDIQYIVWAQYIKEYELLQKHFDAAGVSYASITGQQTSEQKYDSVQAFIKGDVQVLIANPASASYGLTLTNCYSCIYSSVPPSYELFKQSADRIYGSLQMQPHECMYYIITPIGGLQEHIYDNVIGKKQDMSSAILEYIKDAH